MPKINSTSSAVPAKPYPDFPLFPHATKRWAKKIRGKFHYFGPWDDPEGALDNYESQKEALHSGRKPKTTTDEITIKHVANKFLNDKKASVETGELTEHTWRDYKIACDEMLSHFGKNRLVCDIEASEFTQLRFRMAKKWGPHRLSKMIQSVRSAFKHAYDSELIDKPTRFGPNFSRPKKKTLRIHRASLPSKLFTPDEIRDLLKVATPSMKAMILLGINCGFGNSDCGHIVFDFLDLENGWVNFPRPKTGVNRRCPLWPETVEAIHDYLKVRATPKNTEHQNLIFLTLFAQPWFKDSSDNPISNEMKKHLKTVGINRYGVNFYALRHTFRTIADETKDQPAVNHIMGHEPDDMATLYREKISDERLKKVSEYVRSWLFSNG